MILGSQGFVSAHQSLVSNRKLAMSMLAFTGTSKPTLKNFYPRPKKEFLRVVAKVIDRLPQGTLISLSNPSDPYQPLEEKLKFYAVLI